MSGRDLLDRTVAATRPALSGPARGGPPGPGRVSSGRYADGQTRRRRDARRPSVTSGHWQSSARSRSLPQCSRRCRGSPFGPSGSPDWPAGLRARGRRAASVLDGWPLAGVAPTLGRWRRLRPHVRRPRNCVCRFPVRAAIDDRSPPCGGVSPAPSAAHSRLTLGLTSAIGSSFRGTRTYGPGPPEPNHC